MLVGTVDTERYEIYHPLRSQPHGIATVFKWDTCGFLKMLPTQQAEEWASDGKLKSWKRIHGGLRKTWC